LVDTGGSHPHAIFFALYLRSVCPTSIVFYGLKRHPLTCISLKIRLVVNSNPIAPTIKLLRTLELISVPCPQMSSPLCFVRFAQWKYKAHNAGMSGALLFANGVCIHVHRSSNVGVAQKFLPKFEIHSELAQH
jgi:hypothetical protein